MLTLFEGIQLIVFLAILFLLFKGVGEYLSFVLEPQRSIGATVKLHKFLGIPLGREQSWKEYLGALVLFSCVSGIVTLFLLLYQSHFPLNPEHLPDLPFSLAFNIAVSFLTNTDWQAYGGESTLSYFSQMMALTVQNFFSPAVALCAAGALCRGVVREEAKTVGNFWIDLVRIILFLLLPLAIIFSIFFMQQGTPQNLSPYLNLTTLQGADQMIVQGPIASQEAIKVFGSNGGGFTRVNSAHPYENPTFGTGFFQMVGFFAIALGQLYYFGKRTRCLKAVWTVFSVLLVLLTAEVVLCNFVEREGMPHLSGVDATSMGNLEGKEMRFGAFGSSFYAMASTLTSCGAVNAMLSSFTPIGGLLALFNIQFGKALFGGIGVGLCNIAFFALLLTACVGYLSGRAPHYIGKRINAIDLVLAFLAFGCFYLATLGLTAASTGMGAFNDLLYAYSSTAANNGSALAALQANTPWYNYTLACSMLLGRFGTLVPALALAGALAKKKRIPLGKDLFPVKGATLFLLILCGAIVVGLIIFLPSLLIGPVLNQMRMIAGGL